MDYNWMQFIGAAAIATIVSFFGFAYVFLAAAARGERAGIFAAIGLVVGLAIFGSFPLVDIGMKFLKNTSYFQYVRIVTVMLALIIALFIYLDFRSDVVWDKAGGAGLTRILLLGLLMHVVTPLPLDFYNHLIEHSGVAEAAGALLERLTNFKNPMIDPVRTYALPVVAFFVYWLAAIFGHWVHPSVELNNSARVFWMVCGLVIFIGVAAYVAFNGLTYHTTWLDRAINIGVNQVLPRVTN